MMAIGVVILGMIVGFISLCSTKLKDKLPSRLIRIIDKIKSVFFFNVIISSLQTGYLDLWISTNKQILQNILDYMAFTKDTEHRMLKETESLKVRTLVQNTLMWVSFFSLLVAMLVIVTRMIKKNTLEHFQLEETKQRVGALYTNFSTESKPSLFYATFFLARRLFVAAVFVFVQTIALKVELISFSCFVSLSYLIEYKPFKDDLDNKIEIMNEIGLLLANIWCLAFSDLFFDSPEEKIKLGCGFVATIAVLITVNLFFFIKRTVYVFIVERLAKRKAKQQALKAD